MTAPDGKPGPGEVTRVLVGYNSAGVLAYSYLDPAILPTLLADNASSDDTAARAAALGYGVLAMGANAGYARAVNAGLRCANTPFVLIANPDLRLAPGCLKALLAAAKRYRDADIFVPRILKTDGREFFRFETRFEPRVKNRRPPAGDACIIAVSGAILLVRREAFLVAGGFDENIFLYFEDDDIGFRYRAARRAIVFVANAECEHLGDKSSAGAPELSTLKSKSLGWSWAYVMSKHGAGHRWAALGKIAAKTAFHTGTLQVRKAHRDAAILSGFVAAMRGRPAPFPVATADRQGRGNSASVRPVK